MSPRNILILQLAFGYIATGTAADDVPDGTFPAASNLKAGAAKVDITPKNNDGIIVSGHRRTVHGVRDPLRAGVLILDDGKTRAAIITLDTVVAWDEMVKLIRERLEAELEIPGANIMVAASHNHSGPGYEDDAEWAVELINKVASAAHEANDQLRTVTVGYGEDKIGFSVNRRKVIDGRAVMRLNPDGLNDPRVKVLRFDDGESLDPVAVIMHAVCHPCFFTWGDQGTAPYPNGYPKMSADFPGEAQSFVEKCYDGKTSTLFLQGCAGDIRPNLPGFPYRCADEADIQWAGRDLGSAVVRTLAANVTREKLKERPTYYPLRVANTIISLPGKEGRQQAELQAMKIGPYLLLTMPGEPMVEYGFRLEQAIADRATPIIIGYANGDLGYIATAQSYDEGGYEPNTSKLLPEAEQIIIDEFAKLIDQVVGDVFASFSKHPKDIEKREVEEKTRLKKQAGKTNAK